MTFNLATILHESARANPDRPVCHFGDRAMTYAELDDLSARFASNLHRAGFGPGERIAVQLPNVPQFLVAYFGTLKAGLVLVPMNPLLKAAEIAHQLRDSQARLIIAFELCLVEATAAAEQAGGIPVFTISPSSEAVPFDDLLVGPPAPDIAATQADDTAVLIYTSGTTGKPKGAELTHFQLYMNCTTSGQLFGVRDDDVSLAVLPFFHVYGLSGILNVAVRYGTTLVLVPRFETKAVLDVMAAHRVSVFVGVPTMFHALMEADTSGHDLSALRIASSGGASMPGALLHGFEERFGIVILEGYGLSETASTATMNRAGDRRLLSIGKPIWGVDAKVVDGDGNEVPAGSGEPESIGEILLRGHNIMKGYHGDPAATAEALRGGWLHTGDLGYRDADGFLFIVDRSKDLIIRGGYNVYPREIEEVLYTHPAVAEAAVIGKPDERLGEEVVAVIALRPGTTAGAEELIAYCRDRLAAFKYPREVRLVDEIPKSATGKLLKRELRQN